LGLIQGRSGVRPAAEPTNSAPMSLTTTPSASRNSVSVPRFDAPGRSLPELVDNRRISIANEPSRPIQMIPSVVIETFGIGPASTLRAPMNVIDVAMNANATASGSVPSPSQ
jgi:hypothetical protein